MSIIFRLPEEVDFSSAVFTLRPSEIVLRFLRAAAEDERLVRAFEVEDAWFRRDVLIKEMALQDLEEVSKKSALSGGVFFVLDASVDWVKDFLTGMGYLCCPEDSETHVHDGSEPLRRAISHVNNAGFLALCFSHDAESVYVYGHQEAS